MIAVKPKDLIMILSKLRLPVLNYQLLVKIKALNFCPVWAGKKAME